MAEAPMTFMVEDARLIFKNFSGKEGTYNREGDRSFAVILDDEAAAAMLADGWNVKYLKPRPDDEDQIETPYISVAVNFKNLPPNIVMLTEFARTNVSEGMVETLDWANILKCDLVCRSYRWDVNGKTGIKAYLKTMFVTIEEDALERKYALPPEEMEG